MLTTKLLADGARPASRPSPSVARVIVCQPAALSASICAEKRSGEMTSPGKELPASAEGTILWYSRTGTHKANVFATWSLTVGSALVVRLTSCSTTAGSAVVGAGVAGSGLGVRSGVGVAGTGVGVAGTGVGVAGTGVGVAGTGVGGDGSGDVEGPGDPAEGDGEIDGLAESGGDAIVGVHFTRVGFGVGMPLGGTDTRLGDGEAVGDAEGEAVAVGVAVGVGVAAATTAVGVLVGLGAAPG